MTLFGSLVISLKIALYIPNAYAMTAYLIGISGANSLACSPHLLGSQCLFTSSIQETMSREYKVCLTANYETIFEGMTAIEKALHLFAEEHRI